MKLLISVSVSLFKALVLSRKRVKVPLASNGDKIAFFANGPSLTKALEKIKTVGMPNNIMVTNFFCNSNLFEELKPNYYIICDPLFKYNGYKNDKRIPEFYKKIYGVDWAIDIFIPFSFKKDFNKIIIENNLNNELININYYNNVNFNGNNSFLLSLMKKKWGMPRPATVAVPALMNCMYMGYKDIIIAGIDLSHHEDIRVSKENQLQIRTRHFYNNELVESYQPWFKNKEKGITFKTSEIFLIFHNYFFSFDVVADYAKKYNVEITNYSDQSYLDQFKKI